MERNHHQRVTTTQQEVKEYEQEQEHEQGEEVKEEKEEEEVQRTVVSSMPSSVPAHVAIREEAHATYVSQAKRMEKYYNKKTDCLGAFTVGQYVSVPIQMGDHPNRLPYDNIGGVIVECTKHGSYRILTKHGSSLFQPYQFMLANPAQYPELWSQAHKWSSPESCARTVSETGFTT